MAIAAMLLPVALPARRLCVEDSVTPGCAGLKPFSRRVDPDPVNRPRTARIACLMSNARPVRDLKGYSLWHTAQLARVTS